MLAKHPLMDGEKMVWKPMCYLLNWLEKHMPLTMNFPWRDDGWIIRKALQSCRNGTKCSWLDPLWSFAKELLGIAVAEAAP